MSDVPHEPSSHEDAPDDPYAVAFELILAAGSARSTAMEAIEAARDGDTDRARSLLRQADVEFSQAHDIQFGLLQQEARQEGPVELNIILVHAQDHLTMALKTRDNAEELIEVYSRLHTLAALVRAPTAPASPAEPDPAERAATSPSQPPPTTEEN